MLNNSIFFNSTFAPNPFGFSMDGRAFSGEKYRFGFNEKACPLFWRENDNEVKGDGNWQDYGARLYDTRLCRFPTPDPIIIQEHKYPWYSPYQFAGNKPIQYVDIDGLEEGAAMHMYVMYTCNRKDPTVINTFDQVNAKVAMGGLMNVALVIGLLNPFTAEASVSMLITYPLSLTSAGIYTAKTIASTSPGTFDQEKVKKTPNTGTGALFMAGGTVIGFDSENSGKVGDLVESVTNIHSSAKNVSKHPEKTTVIASNTIDAAKGIYNLASTNTSSSNSLANKTSARSGNAVKGRSLESGKYVKRQQQSSQQSTGLSHF